MTDALDRVAECTLVEPSDPQFAEVLKSIAPAVVVVDGDLVAETAATYSRFARVPLIRVDVNARELRVHQGGRRSPVEVREPSSAALREVVAARTRGASTTR